MTCIICPRGCDLTAEQICGNWKISGNGCPRGFDYGVNECTNPMRTVTATVRVKNRKDTMLSVKTEKPVPKGKMFEVMALLRSKAVEAPVAIGQIIYKDVFGTQIVATQKVE